jgi:anti-sigma regulatory factor (Ser/Thr protein kinase)
MTALAFPVCIDLVGNHEVVRRRVSERAMNESIEVRVWDDYELALDSIQADTGDHPRFVLVCALSAREIPEGWIRSAARENGRTRVVVLAPSLSETTAREFVLEGASGVHGVPLPVSPLREWFSLDTFLQTIYPGAFECDRTEIHRLCIPSQREWVVPIIRHLCQRLDSLGYSDDMVRSVFPLVVDEVVTNAMEHGHRWNRELKVEIEATLSPSGFCLIVQDHGSGFDRASVRDPLAEENVRREGGRGLFLIESLVDEVRYEDDGKRVVLAGGEYARYGVEVG